MPLFANMHAVCGEVYSRNPNFEGVVVLMCSRNNEDMQKHFQPIQISVALAGKCNCLRGEGSACSHLRNQNQKNQIEGFTFKI